MVDMMDRVDNLYDNFKTVKQIMVLLYALSAIILPFFEQTGAMPVKNL